MKGIARAALHTWLSPPLSRRGMRVLQRWHGDVAFGILPENRVQLLRIGRIGPGEIHLRRFLRSRRSLFVGLIDEAAAQIFVVNLIRRLRSCTCKERRYQWRVRVEQIHGRKAE